MDKKIKQYIIDEIRKCKSNPIYFMRKYVKIKSPGKPAELFDLYPFQETTLKDFHDYRFNLILKSRQLGITTLVSANCLWHLLFTENPNILAISIKMDVCKEIIKKVKFAFNNLPSWLRALPGEISVNNRTSLTFAGGAEITCASSAGDSGRSKSLSLLILDEAAYIEQAEEVWSSAFGTLSNGGHAVILSTPNGVGNWFYDFWSKAEKKENDFHTIILRWNLHPKRDQKWRDEQTKALGQRMAAQECDADFLTSGATMISGEKLRELYSLTKNPIEKRRNESIWVFEESDPASSYLITADTSRGDGSDYSAAQILKIKNEKLIQVGEMKEKLTPREFGIILVSLAQEYNNALLIIEKTGIGYSTLQSVLDSNYSNLFYSAENLRVVDTRNKTTAEKFTDEDKYNKCGFETSYITRPLVVNKLEECIRRNLVEIKSKRTIEELTTFVWTDRGRVEAAQGTNDDLIISLAIGLWINSQYVQRYQPVGSGYSIPLIQMA